MTVWPATVRVPVRSLVALLAVALNVTVPLPDPLEPPLILSQPALLVADQLQPDPAVTVVVEVSPVAASIRHVGETPYVHPAGAPLWVTVTVWPATVRVPVRSLVALLAVALNVTVPLPDPLEPPLILSQPVLLVAVQPHPPAAVTVVVEEPAV